MAIAGRVEAANIFGPQDHKARRRLLGGLRFAFPNMRVIIADASHDSRKLGKELRRHDGYELQIVKRKHRAFQGRWVDLDRGAQLRTVRTIRLGKDHEFRVQTSEAMIDLAATRIMLNRIAQA
jgi:hypothetical protein